MGKKVKKEESKHVFEHKSQKFINNILKVDMYHLIKNSRNDNAKANF